MRFEVNHAAIFEKGGESFHATEDIFQVIEDAEKENNVIPLAEIPGPKITGNDLGFNAPEVSGILKVLRPGGPILVNSCHFASARHGGAKREKAIVCTDIQDSLATQSPDVWDLHGTPHLELKVSLSQEFPLMRLPSGKGMLCHQIGDLFGESTSLP